MKLVFRSRAFFLSLATLGTVTFATALVVACGEMDKSATPTTSEPTPNVEPVQISKDLDALEALAKNVKIDPVVATHDALTWLNIPPLTTTSKLNAQLDWAIGKATTAAEAGALVWQKGLPVSTSAVHAERHLWARIAPKATATDPQLTRYLDLTQSSGIQQVRTNLDAVVNATPALQLTALKLSGTTDEIILENAPAAHPGLALQWSIRVGTTIMGESWYDWTGFTTLLRATKPTANDLQTIRVRYVLVDATLYQIKNNFETAPSLIQITPAVTNQPIDVLAEVKNVLGQIRVDVTNSVHSSLLWINTPQIATSWASELLSIEYRTTLASNGTDIEYSDWTLELPQATAFSSEVRSVTARITPQRGVSWEVTELDLTTSSEISRVISLLDALPAVQAALAATDLSKVQLFSKDAYGNFGALSITTNNEAALSTLREHQIELRFAYQNGNKWLTFAELQAFVETDEAFANYKADDFGSLEGKVLARLEYLGSSKQVTLRDRKTALVNVRELTPLSTYTVADRVTRLVRRAAVVNTAESVHSNLMWPFAMNYEVQLTPAMKAGIRDLRFTYTYNEPTPANPNPEMITFYKLPNVTIGDYTKRVLTAEFFTTNNVRVDLDLTESSQIKNVKRLLDATYNYRELAIPEFLINLTDENRTWDELDNGSAEITKFEWNTNILLYAKGSVDYQAYSRAGVQLKARITRNGTASIINLNELPTFLTRRISTWRMTAKLGEVYGIEKIEVFFTPLDSTHDTMNGDKTTAIMLTERLDTYNITFSGFKPFTA